MLVWAFNYSQCIKNVILATMNKNNFIIPFEIYFYQAAATLILTGFYNLIMTNDYNEFIEPLSDEQKGPQLISMLVATSIMSILSTFSMLAVVMLSGPVVVTIAATLRDLILSYIGFTFFADGDFTILVIGGLAVSFAGAAHDLVTKMLKLK